MVRKLYKIIILILLIVRVPTAYGQEDIRAKPADPNIPFEKIDDDSMKSNAKVSAFYKMLEERSKTRKFYRFLYNSIITSGNHSSRDGEIIDETELLENFNGKNIASINIERHDVLDRNNSRIQRFVNGMHIRTMESTVRRDLLFGEGDRFDASVIVASNQILRSRRYISDSHVYARLNEQDTTAVDIYITTRDSWTIGVDAELYSADKQLMFKVYDANIIGSGNRLGIRTHLGWEGTTYGGNIVEYDIPNLMGSFYNASLAAGRNFGDRTLSVGIGKKFILPSDYETGISFSDDKTTKYKLLGSDTLDYVTVSANMFDAWAGKSFYIKSLNSSIYLTGRYSHAEFDDRPDVRPDSNAIFHNYNQVLFGLGIYREKFYTSSMIYGYGFREYIASGHKFEVVGGYSRQEFGKYYYVGLKGSKGGFTPVGYLAGDVTLGSYIGSHTGKFWRSSLNAELRWFSNLFGKRQSKVRQFVKVSYTQGWNMGKGGGALIRFDQEHQPVSFNYYAAGSTRILLNTETVVFTPLQPLGFRIALFGFADAGLIGQDNNAFRNDFYSSFGIGIRLKNERLVFDAIQLRLGFASDRKGFIDNRRFTVSSEQRIGQNRYISTRPETVYYR